MRPIMTTTSTSTRNPLLVRGKFLPFNKWEPYEKKFVPAITSEETISADLQEKEVIPDW